MLENTPNYLTATAAVQEIINGNLSATELMASCVRRIKEMDSKIKAWSYFDEEQALDAANKIDEKLNRGDPPGKLCGVPVGVKDIFNTIDMPCCMGSPIWKGFTPGNDARVVSYLKWADAVIAGKTATAEFAVHHPPPTINPHNSEYSPGTSSSGSAAAVASYMIPVAIGTQTAGSTIRPASYCGVFGFKPSFGLIPRTGVLKTLDTLDHITFLSRSVADLLLMLDTLRVKGPNYPYVHKSMDNPESIKSQNDYPWKVAFVKSPAWNYAEAYAKESIINYTSRLEKLDGIILKEVDLPTEFNEAHGTHELIYTKALSYYFREEYENHSDKLSEIFRIMVEKGRQITTETYLEGLEKQKAFIKQLDTFFEQYDVIITLSTSSDAPKGLHTRDKKDSCLIWTLCHVPTINLPVFRSPNNLPFGAHIITRQYRDYNLLNFAKYLENEGLLKSWKDQ